MSYRPPYPLTYQRPRRKRPSWVYVGRLHRSLAIAAGLCLVIAFGSFGGDLHPAITLAASLGTLAACCVGLANLFKLRP